MHVAAQVQVKSCVAAGFPPLGLTDLSPHQLLPLHPPGWEMCRCYCIGQLRSGPLWAYGTAGIAYTPSQNFADYSGRLRFLSDSWMSDICWLFCNIPQAAFSTKPESGISAKKSSESCVFKPGKLVLGLFPLIRVNHKKAPFLLPSSLGACAGGDLNFEIFGGMLVLLWHYITNEGWIRSMLFIWAFVQ